MLMILASGAGYPVENNKGAEKILLAGGESGTVTFPHHRHQDTVGDCKVCHKWFPQESGAITRLKAEEKLAKKQVMNKLCLQCHREKKAAGETKYGPITCKQCHKKS